MNKTKRKELKKSKKKNEFAAMKNQKLVLFCSWKLRCIAAVFFNPHIKKEENL